MAQMMYDDLKVPTVVWLKFCFMSLIIYIYHCFKYFILVLFKFNIITQHDLHTVKLTFKTDLLKTIK